MPLVFTTDEIIAGKYRLKKPIPVSFEFDYDDTHLEVFDESYIFEPENIDAEKQLGDIINLNYPRNIYGEPYNQEKFQRFREKLMEYLEEIN